MATNRLSKECDSLSAGRLSVSAVSSRSTALASETSEKSSSKLIKSPLDGIAQEDLLLAAEQFADQHGLAEHKDIIMKGALVAQNPDAFESLPLLTEEDRAALRREKTHPWSQPWNLYYLVLTCSLAAAVQGVSLLRDLVMFFVT